MQLASSNQIDPEILFIVMTSKSLTEMRELCMQSIRSKKLENNQVMQLQQQLEQAMQQQKEMQKQLEESTRKIAQLNEKKLNIEQQNNQMQQEIDYYKIETEKELKEKELELIKDRNKLEAVQIIADDGKGNDEVLNNKY